MKTLLIAQLKGATNYPKWPILPSSFFAALLLVLYTEEDGYLDLLVLPAFYWAIGINTLMVLLVVVLIFIITLYLDLRWPWYRNYSKRLRYQLLLGLLLPLALTYVLALGYFGYYGIKLGHTIWFSHYLRQIVFMLLLPNVYFFYHYHRQRNKPTPRKALLPPKMLPVVNTDQLACVFSLAKHYFSIDMDGEQQIWLLNIRQTRSCLPPDQFYFINRGCAINLAGIADIQVQSAKVTWVRLLPPVAAALAQIRSKYQNIEKRDAFKGMKINVSNTVRHPVGFDFRVSGSENTAFKKMYMAYRTVKVRKLK